jgi:N-hydroxyarylamine O-acetyltransferase
MTPPELDLDAYFARIGFEGEAAPDLATLQALHALHPAAIPFENLDPLLGLPIALDLASLQAKLVHGGRGGYCFEHNTLFKAALEQIGFAVTGLIARVRWMVTADAPPTPRTHMILMVELESERWLCDVGFGGHLAAAPIRLRLGIEQATPWNTVRLVTVGELIALETRLPAGWKECYRFSLEPAFAADQELANWFTSAHPASRFRNSLVCERLTPETRFTLGNGRYIRRHRDGRIEESAIDSAATLAEALTVGLGLPASIDAEAVWRRLSEV